MKKDYWFKKGDTIEVTTDRKIAGEVRTGVRGRVFQNQVNNLVGVELEGLKPEIAIFDDELRLVTP